MENDPGRCDPDFWLDYFKRIHVEGALLSAGGVVAFYPTKIPLHHRSDTLGDTDLLGYMMEGCRKLNITVCVRTDPHAARQNVYDAHPDWIAVTADGQKRRHWANPDLWVTCGLGPYNFDFMTQVHKEIMQMYKPEGIFSNRWSGGGNLTIWNPLIDIDRQGRSSTIPPWNSGRGAKELRAGGMAMKPLIHIFSVGSTDSPSRCHKYLITR